MSSNSSFDTEIVMRVNVDNGSVTSVNKLKDSVDSVNDSVQETGEVSTKTFKNFKGEIKAATQEVYNMFKTYGEGSKQVADAQKKLSDLKETQDNLFSPKTIKSFRQEIKEATNELYQLSKTYGEGSKQVVAAQKKLASLKDTQEDLNTQTKAFNPDNKFQGLVGIASGAAAAVQGIAGAFTLVGVSSETAQVAVAKLQGIMAFTSALGQIDGIKNSFQALRNVVLTELIPSLLTAKGLLTSLGIGAVITGIVLLYNYMEKLTKQTEKLNFVTKQLREVNNEAAKGAVNEQVQLDILYQSAQNVNLSLTTRLEKVKELQSKYPGYFEDIKTEKDLNDKLTVAYNDATKGILAKAHATAIFNKIVENENKILDLQTKNQEAQTKADEAKASYIKSFEQRKADEVKKKNAESIDQLNKANKALEQTVINSTTPTTDDKKLEQAEKDKKDAADKADSKRANDLKLQLKEQFDELLKQRKQFDDELEQLRQGAISEAKAGLDKELFDIDNASKERIKKLDDNETKEQELLKKQLTDKTISQQEYNATNKKIEDFYNQQAIKDLRVTASLKQSVTDKFNKEANDKVQEYFKKNADTNKDEFDKQIDTINTEVDELLKTLTDPNVITQLKAFRDKSIDAIKVKKDDANTEKNFDINVTRSQTNVLRTQNENPVNPLDDTDTRIGKIKGNINAELELEDALYAQKKIKAKDNADELDKIEQEHTANKLSITKKGENDTSKAREEGLNNTIQTLSSVGSALTELGTLFDEQTAASKAINVASAIMNTGLGITQIWANKTTIPEPGGTIQKVAATAIAAISGYKAVKQILSAKTKGGGGSAAPPAPASLNSTLVNLPVTPQDVRVVNQPGQQLVRAYISQDELVNQQQKNKFYASLVDN